MQTAPSPKPGLRPQIAVVAPYWRFWEHSVGSNLRDRKLQQAREVVRAISPSADTVQLWQPDSLEEAEAAGRRLRNEAIDAVLVLCSMAVPPATSTGLLDLITDVPAVIWAIHDTSDGLPAAFDHAEITTQGATVGAPMLTSALVRRGRPFELILGQRGDPDCLARVCRALLQAAVAGRLHQSRIGLVGSPQEGYEHVRLDPKELKTATGMSVVAIPAAELVERYRRVDDNRLRALEAETRAEWRLLPGVEQEERLDRSLRAAVGLEQLGMDYDLHAGAVNCHLPEIRFGQEIGITPCYALGRMTSLGVPWTCTGDVSTVIAMLVAKWLGGPSLYHELEAVDYKTGELVIANSGEHDLGWQAAGDPPRLAPNGWFCGQDIRCGVCAVMELPPGPATLIGFTPHAGAVGGFRFVVAAGELTGRGFPETGTSNGAFRFSSGPVQFAWERWASAGVSHHSCLTAGDRTADIAVVARYLEVECVQA